MYHQIELNETIDIRIEYAGCLTNGVIELGKLYTKFEE